MRVYVDTNMVYHVDSLTPREILKIFRHLNRLKWTKPLYLLDYKEMDWQI